MGGSGVIGVGGGVGRMVRKHMWCATGFSGVDWFPIGILDGRAGGAVDISSFGGGTGVCTGDGGCAGAEGCWVITLGATGGFSLGAGWVLCSGIEYGRIIRRGLDRKMSRIQVRGSKCSVCSVAGTSLMVHDSKWSAWTMPSSGVTVGLVRYEWQNLMVSLIRTALVVVSTTLL